jgi:hypothetical protein
MDATSSAAENDARVGLALRTVLDVLPQQAQLIVRLDAAERRQAAEAQLNYLQSKAILTSSQLEALRRQLAGDHPTDAAATDAPGVSGVPQALAVFGVLSAAVATQPATDSFLDTLWDAAVTIVGVIVGESIGGPAGALAGGIAAHQWATENPPSTWFR